MKIYSELLIEIDVLCALRFQPIRLLIVWIGLRALTCSM